MGKYIYKNIYIVAAELKQINCAPAYSAAAITSRNSVIIRPAAPLLCLCGIGLAAYVCLKMSNLLVYHIFYKMSRVIKKINKKEGFMSNPSPHILNFYSVFFAAARASARFWRSSAARLRSSALAAFSFIFSL